MENMRKLVMFLECGVGTKTAEAYLVPESIKQLELDNYAWERALEHGQCYGTYPMYEMPEGWEDEEHDSRSDEYTDDIAGWWEEYNEDEHDGQLIFGAHSSFQWKQF